MARPFVRQLLGYLPDQTLRSFRAPLRCVDFYDGYAVYRDSRRKAETIWIPPSCRSAGTLPGTSGSIWSEPRSAFRRHS
jgi:hypothetical protein